MNLFRAAVMAAVVSATLAEGPTTARGEVNELLRPAQDASAGPHEHALVPIDPVAASEINSRRLYLNDCMPGGCVVRSGFESSINDTSSVISGTRAISPFAHGAAVWNEVVACVRDTFAPYRIEIVTEDPAPAAHWENLVAGWPEEAGFGSAVGGVSPFNCGIINNSIAFSFANAYEPDVARLCWTVAKASAFTWGLEREFLQNDPMTSLPGSTLPGGFKRFQDETAPCGDDRVRACECGGTTQNSHARLIDVFGTGAPSPPVVTITSPLADQALMRHFSVRVDVAAVNGVASVRMEIDDDAVATLTTLPYVFDAPADLPDGAHTVRVIAVDTQGTEGAAEVEVVVGPPTSGGCQSGTRGGSPPVILVALALIVAGLGGRRQQRRA